MNSHPAAPLTSQDEFKTKALAVGVDDCSPSSLRKKRGARTKPGSKKPDHARRPEKFETQAAQVAVPAEEVPTSQMETLSEALRASEVSYRRLFESAKDGILILDAGTGCIEDVNPFLVKLLGFDRSEIVGKTVGELSPFKDIVSNQEMLERLQADGYVRYEDLPLETKDGRHVAVEFVSNVYQAGDKKVIQCNIRDITARKAAETKVRESEELLRLTISSVRDCAIIRLDPQGNILNWNLGAELIKGWQSGEILGQRFSKFYSAEDVAARKPECLLQQAADLGWVEDEGWRMRKDGSRFWADVVITTLRSPAGQLSGYVKVTRDQTTAKNAENENRRLHAELEQRVLERTAQLRTANGDLEAFSYSVSHDLRAPLRHVIGYVELLKKSATAVLAEKDRRYLKTISDSAGRMDQLIDDLLTFSRVGCGAMNRAEVDLDQLVREVVDGFQAETAGRKIEWDIHALAPLWADRSLLRMVLVNLISNAIKFTGSRGAASIEIGSSSVKDGVTIFIRDNGVGFNPQYTEKLFGVFQRLHSQAEFEGTGIGLANVQRIIHRHGGRVWAEGVVGGGATFSFTIPQKKGDHREA